MNLWGALWQSRNRIDGLRKHIIYHNGMPALFQSRSKSRQFISENYGYIRTRLDLRAEPHGWRVPKAVRVKVALGNFNKAK